MILVGLNGGMRQGKSTVGEELRRLAGVDYKADLEFSYPIGQVCNAWTQAWVPSVLESGLPTREIANKLIPLLAAPVKEVTGQDIDIEKLLIEDTPASLEESNRLLSYLENYIEAGDKRDEEFPLPITPDNKVLHRALYMWVGARLIDEVDLGPETDLWAEVIRHRIETLKRREYALVTVGGVRYPLQQAMIRAQGGVIVQVERPGIAVDSDITERANDGHAPDITVLNNGNVEQLHTVVGQLYDDLLTGKTKAKYKAV